MFAIISMLRLGNIPQYLCIYQAEIDYRFLMA